MKPDDLYWHFGECVLLNEMQVIEEDNRIIIVKGIYREFCIYAIILITDKKKDIFSSFVDSI